MAMAITKTALEAGGALSEVEARLHAALRATGALEFAAGYHLRTGGKRSRARLALDAAAALGVSAEAAVDVAVACELLHNASLVHDDVQDRDLTRRGRPAVWALLGDEVAIGLGDAWIAAAVDAAACAAAPSELRNALVRSVARTIRDCVRGQAADGAARGSLALTPEEYESIARAKTGPLFALPVEAALILADAPWEELEAAREALGWLGAAYQVQDDLLDLYGWKDRDELASDLRQGRPSAPVIQWLRSASASERSRFRHRERSPEENRAWARVIRDSGAVAASVAQYRSLERLALRHASRLPAHLERVLGQVAHEMSEPVRRIERSRAAASSEAAA